MRAALDEASACSARRARHGRRRSRWAAILLYVGITREQGEAQPETGGLTVEGESHRVHLCRCG
jgi:hypothetical protein